MMIWVRICLLGLMFFGVRVKPAAASAECRDSRDVVALEKATAAGEVEAMTALAWRLYNGAGVPVDRDRAVQLWTRAAEKGASRAMARLGQPRPHADLGEREYPSRVRWLQAAAEKRDPLGMVALGVASIEGRPALKQDTQAGLRWVQQAAEGGSVFGMLVMAALYHDGVGVPKDANQCAAWAERAAAAADKHPEELGCEDLGALAGMCFRNIGLARDAGRAIKWAQAGADLGDPFCAYEVGLIYLTGRGGVNKDLAKAAQWFERSNRGQYFMAARMLGMLCINGEGIPKDVERGAGLMRQAAAVGDPDALWALGRIHADQQGGLYDIAEAMKCLQRAADLKHPDAVRDLAKAADQLRQSAEAGDVESMMQLGLAYTRGTGVARDLAQDLKWSRRAGEAGNAGAMNNVGYLYADAMGDKADLVEAVKWFRKAADAGNASAIGTLGSYMLAGHGVDKDPEQGASWLLKAAEAGNTKAMGNLGMVYTQGVGVARDYAEALKWLRKGVAAGDPGATYNMGIMYLKGYGVDANAREAEKYLRKAAEMGNANAKKWVEANPREVPSE